MRHLYERSAGLAAPNYGSVDARVAANWATAPCTLDTFARHSDPEIRLAVAGNLMASAETIKHLASDANDAVALAALIHPVRDLSAQEALDLRIRHAAAAAEHSAGDCGHAVQDFLRRARELLGPWTVCAERP